MSLGDNWKNTGLQLSPIIEDTDKHNKTRSPQREQILQLLIAQITNPVLIGGYGHFCKGLLRLDHLVDAFFKRVLGNKTVCYNIAP